MATIKADQIETVGFIISKVEDDLKRLAEEVHRVSKTSDPRQTERLEDALKKTRSDLKGYAERILHESQNDAKELPPINISTSVTNARSPRSLHELVEHHKSHKKTSLHRKQSRQPTVGRSPGEMVKMMYVDKLLSQPHNQASKQLISDRYGIPMSAMRPAALTVLKEDTPPHPMKPVTGLTVGQLPALPHSKRGDVLATPPLIMEDDSKKGLLSLLERGLIPTSANIVMNPAPIKPKAAVLHSASQHHIKQDICDNAEMKHFPLVHLDLREPEELIKETRVATGQKSHSRINKVTGNPVPVQAGSDSDHAPSAPSVHTRSPDPQTPHPTRSINVAGRSSRLRPSQPLSDEEFYISIHKGVSAEDHPDFIKFKNKHLSEWGRIAELLHRYKVLAYSYAIPLIVVSADKLSKLSERFEVELKPTHQDLLHCMVNASEVQHLLETPGRRFRGAGGHNLAAAKIQATFRMFKKRKEYLEYRRKKWAAGIIAMGWLLLLKARGIREQLKQKRANQRINFIRRSKELQKKWTSLRSSPHVVIHLPSLGYIEGLRSETDNFKIQENSQIGRIGYLNNPNVEVIYISPVKVCDELEEYYCKLLLLGSEGSSMEDVKRRLTIITPENSQKFGAKNLHLSAVLLYSPRTIKRLKNLIKGKDSYIVPGVMSESDLALADELNLPILGTDPHTVHLYSSKKAGALKLFKEANVPIPPSSVDVFSEGQVVRHLSQLIASHLSVQRWCFKLNNSMCGRAIAYCDVLVHLPCYQWLMKEREWYGAEWSQTWVQETAVNKISEELPAVLEKHIKMADPSRFPTWKSFLTEMKRTGGVIQACPPPDSVTAITVNLLMEPGGMGTILSTGDQVNPRPFWKWGVSVPQTSICLSHLTEDVTMVAAALQDRGIAGYVSVDFVTFISPDTLQQELWAVDIDIGMTTCQSMYFLLVHITRGSFLWSEGTYNIMNSHNQPEARFAVMSTQLFHDSLSVIQSSVFFHLCKAHLIGYNTQDKVGCVFTMPDSSDRRHMGMICVEETLSMSLTKMATSLSVIHQEVAISSEADTNYKDVALELNRITSALENEEGNE